MTLNLNPAGSGENLWFQKKEPRYNVKVAMYSCLLPEFHLTEALRTMLTEALRTMLTEALRTMLTEALRTMLTEALRAMLTEALRTMLTEALRTMLTEVSYCRTLLRL